MNECIDTLSETNIFSTLDYNSDYWKISIDEQDREKSAFVSHHGLFQFADMPVLLANAPGAFQSAIFIFLSSVEIKFVIVFRDDIIVFSKRLKNT